MRRLRQVTLHRAFNVPPSSDASLQPAVMEDLAASLSATAASSGSKEDPLVASVVHIDACRTSRRNRSPRRSDVWHAQDGCL